MAGDLLLMVQRGHRPPGRHCFVTGKACKIERKELRAGQPSIAAGENKPTRPGADSAAIVSCDRGGGGSRRFGGVCRSTRAHATRLVPPRNLFGGQIRKLAFA